LINQQLVAAHRAITIDRSPEKVWPWIAQFGRGAAYYSWDFLDNRGHRHADYLLNIGEPEVGDWNQDLGRICYIDRGNELVWYDELIETYEERVEGGETNRSLAPHQLSPWRPASANEEIST